MIYRLLLILLPLLVSCGPIYRTHTTYHPPADERGRACVAQCQAVKTLCNSNCELKEQVCRQEAQLQAQDAYQDAKRAYEKDMRVYRRRERDFLSCQKRARKEDWQKDFPTLESYCADRTLYGMGGKPTLPELDVRDSHCTRSCSCDRDYDVCFQGCGGGITHQRECVANCKKK